MIIDEGTKKIFCDLKRCVDLETFTERVFPEPAAMATFSHVVYGDVHRVEGPEGSSLRMENDPSGAGLRDFSLLLKRFAMPDALESLVGVKQKSGGLTRSIG